MSTSESAVQGIELENWNKMIPDLIFNNDTLYTRLKKNAKTNASANITYAGGVGRPAFRVPMRVQSASAIVQGTGDGDSLGRGTQSQWISGDISPVFFFNGCEITHLTEIATSGPKRAMLTVKAQELKNSLTSFMNGLEALSQGDGSGALDTLPATATVTTGAGVSKIVGLTNINQFQDQQTIDFYNTEGGTLEGTGVVSYVDQQFNTLWFSTDLSTVSGLSSGATYVLAIHDGNAASTGGVTSLAGIKTYQVNSNTGSVLNLNRATYPGRLSTPLIDLGGKAVNPAVPYRAEILIKRGLGPDSEAAKDFIWYGPPEQRLAITNLYQGILLQNDIGFGGNTAPDVVKKNMADKFGSREYVESYNATPGRIDGLCLKEWGIAEMVEPRLYNFGNGVTSMPVVDTSTGGYLTANIFYYEACYNIFNSNMKAGVIINNAATPLV
jgi:hypothetical protein